MRPVAVAIIGSFRRHLRQVSAARNVFVTHGMDVTSPVSTELVTPKDIEFVRFGSDDCHATDAEVQTLALHRILRADAVYVVNPRGYVGRTTCYEIGRIVQARRPLYFTNTPRDLPIFVPVSHIVSAERLVDLLTSSRTEELYASCSGSAAELENRLLVGDYVAK